jgi:hypothetical protein
LKRISTSSSGNLPSLTRDCDFYINPIKIFLDYYCGNLPSLTRDCDISHHCPLNEDALKISCGNLPSLTRDCDIL